MKRQRHLNLNEMDTEPPRKRYKTLRIRPRKRIYYTRSVNRTHYSADVIARFWRKYKRNLPSNNTENEATIGYQRKNGKNVICCITQDKIPNKMCFKFFSLQTAHVHSYTIPDLVDYFKTSGNFTCPMTREEFPQCAVRRLSLKAFKLGIPAMNLTGIFAMRQQIINRQIERDNRILAIENTCGLAMTECIDMCGNFTVSTVVAAHNLLNLLIPEWKQLVDDYARFSLEDCRLMVVSDKDKMLRLQRSNVSNPHRLIKFVDEAIDEKLEQLNRMAGRGVQRSVSTQEPQPAPVMPMRGMDDALSFLNNLPPLPPIIPSFTAPILSDENARPGLMSQEDTIAMISDRIFSSLSRPLSELGLDQLADSPPPPPRITYRFTPPRDPDF